MTRYPASSRTAGLLHVLVPLPYFFFLRSSLENKELPKIMPTIPIAINRNAIPSFPANVTPAKVCIL